MKDQAKDSLVELKIPNKPEFLRVVRLFISGYASRWQLPVDEVEDIKVAISEVCNNAIKGSDESGEISQIKIKCWQLEDYLVFEIKDKSSKNSLIEGESEEDGLGMLLIKTLMDEVEVISDVDKDKKIIMKKKIQPD
ncbi:MAG TPA: ATP-binding protein [bacterium]|nr:ATP-binding protein [bacterium]